MRVLHISTGLNLGGAETMLYRLLQVRDARDSHHVLSLLDVGPIGEKIAELGIAPYALKLHRIPNPVKMLELARVIAEFRPDVVQTWMYHADLVGGIAARLGGCGRVVWGIHHGTVDPATTRRATRLVVAASARLSRRIPDAIVCVSRAAKTHHIAMGYDATKFWIIPNGFDLSEFRPDDGVRREVRNELRIPEDSVLVGMVARVNPQKDHINFIRAASILAKRHSNVRFLLCGGPGARGALGATPDNQFLVRPLEKLGLLDRFILVGQRDDVSRVMRAFDIGTLASNGEAFPLVIGEMMACGVPCVVTDVGDSAYLVGDKGRVVAPRDPVALARGWEELVDMGLEQRQRLGQDARSRMEKQFSLPRIAEQYCALWRHVLEGNPQQNGSKSENDSCGGSAASAKPGCS